MLLERDRELSVLATLAEAVARGDSGLVVIEGPAGIGKTRLLGEARRYARAASVRVLVARGGELEQELALGAVHQLFEAAVSEPLLEGAAATAREAFDGAAGGTTGEEASFAILHGLYRLTVNLTEQAPLLLVIDDLQWCDEPSLRWLCYLVRRLDGLRVAVVCGVRPFERHAHAHLIGEIVRDPLTVSLRPEPLSERAMEDRSVRRRTRAVQGASRLCAFGVGVVPRWARAGRPPFRRGASQ